MARKKQEAPVPTGTDMVREMTSATAAAEAEVRAADKAAATTVVTTMNQTVDDDTGERMGGEEIVTHTTESSASSTHNLTNLDLILDHTYGRNVSGRFVYSLNFLAQRLARELLKKEITEQEKDPAERAAEAEINDYFGFNGAAQDEYGHDLPVVTLEDALHWQTLTWMYVMDLAQYTEADERGLKSKPFAWMAQLVKNPITMVYSDARYGQRQQVDQQVINAAKLGLKDDLLAEAQAKYDAETKVVTEARTHEKLNVLRGHMRGKDEYKNLSTEDLNEAITQMCVTLGIDVPKFMSDLAADYKFKATERALAGKYIGEVDESMLSFIPEHKMSWIGKSHEERLAEARARHEARKPGVIDSAIEADKATKTPEAQEELRRKLRRVTREEAEQQTAMKAAMSKAGHGLAH